MGRRLVLGFSFVDDLFYCHYSARQHSMLNLSALSRDVVILLFPLRSSGVAEKWPQDLCGVRRVHVVDEWSRGLFFLLKSPFVQALISTMVCAIFAGKGIRGRNTTTL